MTKDQEIAELRRQVAKWEELYEDADDRHVDSIVEWEEERDNLQEFIIQLEARITKLTALKPWEDKAVLLLAEGMTQQAVADSLGKGIATVKRLVKRLKENNK